MKKKLLIFVVLICTLSKGHAFSKVDSTCNFLKNIEFKNGVDTIIVKGRFHSFFRSPDYRILKELDKEKLIKYADFGEDKSGIDESSAVSFFTGNCPTFYSGTLRNNIDPNYISQLKEGDVILLTCIVFSTKRFNHPEIFKKDEPYFLILSVSTIH
jgi:hypothetical protein